MTDRERHPPQRSSTKTIAATLVGIAFAAVVVVLLLPQISEWFQPAIVRQIHTAVDGASAICLRDIDQHEGDKFSANVKGKLVDNAAGGELSRQQVSKSVNLAINDNLLIQERVRVSACMERKVDELLADQGVIVKEGAPVPAPPASQQPAPQVPQTKVDFAFDKQCFDDKITALIGPQTLTGNASVRCEGGGDSKSSSVAVQAPAGFELSGPAVLKENSSNHGSTGPIQQTLTLGVVTGSTAAFSCSTPHQLFGPGGWEDVTLTATARRSKPASQSETDAIKRECPADSAAASSGQSQ
jgi:hypothetical protein